MNYFDEWMYNQELESKDLVSSHHLVKIAILPHGNRALGKGTRDIRRSSVEGPLHLTYRVCIGRRLSGSLWV